MPRYRTKFVGRSGRKGAANLDAVDLVSLSEHIETSRRAYIIEITRLSEANATFSGLGLSGPMLLAALDSLDLMLRSGVRINSAVRTLAECAPSGRPRRVWTEIVCAVEETGSFGHAIRRFPKIFNEPMVGIIVAHEAAGRLSDGIKNVRAYVAQMQEIRQESLRGATYPMFVCICGIFSSLVLCVFTLPRFAKMLADIGVTKTNKVTAFFFGLSRFVTYHPYYTFGLAVLPIALLWVISRPRFRPSVDKVICRLPVIRQAVDALVMARICVTYHALSEAGIRVVEALEFSASAAGNYVYSRGIGQVIETIRENASVGEGFCRAGVFTPEVVLAIRSGEGSLPQVFGRLAEFYTTESRHRVAMALRLVEPAMLMLVLDWVFGVALAVVLPVVEIIDEIH
jgi:type IV pilus assembly protein PilC